LIEITIAREDESGCDDGVNQRRSIWARDTESCDYHELAKLGSCYLVIVLA